VLRRLLVTGALAALAVAGTAAGGTTSAPACTAGKLGGVFAVVRDSAGAGSISYDLRLRNVSSGKCFVTGRPGLRLLGKTGTPLPTSVVADTTAGQPVRVVLKPGGYAAATARFSPDIPGTGEPQMKQCEPAAYKLKISPAGGGTLIAPVSPHTPVCEHGRIVLTVLVAGTHGPRS
jgi:Protein of unknown function (DUF4232)